MSETRRSDLPPMQRNSGHCWTVRLPAGFPAGDGIDDNERSLLRLYEDGVELGPAHAHHADIRTHGGGRFSHWGDTLFLSSSDNSDIAANGRRYSVEVPPGAIGRDPATIPEQVDYALWQARHQLTLLRGRGLSPQGLSILEIGPGKNFGAAVLLAASGARVTVADRFLSPWVDGFHQQLFTALADAWDGPREVLDRMVAAGSFDVAFTRLAQPAERLDGVATGSIDVVSSTSVLEHVYDFAAVMAELHRVTRPGGWQFHAVDLKDHQGYGRSLDHLLMSRADFDAANAAVQHQRGCQTRASEMEAMMARAGFEIVGADRNTIADADYFAGVLAALRASSSPYAAWPEDDLRVIEATYHLRVA